MRGPIAAIVGIVTEPFDLVVLGDVNPDLILRGGDLVPAFGQAERLVDEATLTVGGSGAITACAAARLGLRVAICGVVGDDLFGRAMLEQLAARGVDVAGVAVDAHRPTGVTVVLSAGDDRASLTSPGTIGDLRRELLDDELLTSARHVHVASYFLQRGLVADLPDLFAAVRAAGARPRSIRTGTPRRPGTAVCSTSSASPTCSSRTRWRQRGSPARPTWRRRRGALADEGDVVVVKDGAHGALAAVGERPHAGPGARPRVPSTRPGPATRSTPG